MQMTGLTFKLIKQSAMCYLFGEHYELYIFFTNMHRTLDYNGG